MDLKDDNKLGMLEGGGEKGEIRHMQKEASEMYNESFSLTMWKGGGKDGRKSMSEGTELGKGRMFACVASHSN